MVSSYSSLGIKLPAMACGGQSTRYSPETVQRGMRYIYHRLFHEERYSFIDQMVQLVISFRHYRYHVNLDPNPSGFTTLIGALLRTNLQCDSTPALDNEVEQVARKCAGMTDPAEFVIEICCFLGGYQFLLRSHNPKFYFQYFVVLCKLCMKFAEYRKLCFIQLSKEVAKTFFYIHSDDFRRFDTLESYAREKLTLYGYNFS